MITNLARFTLFPVLLLAGYAPVYAGEQIVPAVDEPIQPVPVDSQLDENRVALGSLLFNDPRLSRDNSLSCASCHHLESGGDDGLPTGIALGGNTHTINTPTVFNARFNFRQLWNGSAESLEQQVDHAVHSRMEAGSNWDELLTKLSKDPTLVRKFDEIYRDGITRANYLDALTEFEKSLVTPNSRFDQYLLGDNGAISDDEKKGYQRFKELGCISCHQGINVGGNLFQKFGIFYDYLAERGGITEADLGRINSTGREADKYVFKVPTLRNVEVTAPYLHDGRAGTLEQAIAIMGRTQTGKTLGDQDIALIAGFLKTLTGEYKGKPLARRSGTSDPGAGLSDTADSDRSGPGRNGRERS